MTIEPTRSEEYTTLLEELRNSFVSAATMAVKLYEQGKKDGLSNEAIRKDIEIALDGVVKKRRLREILPIELKRQYTVSDSALSAESEQEEPDSEEIESFEDDLDEKEFILESELESEYSNKLQLLVELQQVYKEGVLRGYPRYLDYLTHGYLMRGDTLVGLELNGVMKEILCFLCLYVDKNDNPWVYKEGNKGFTRHHIINHIENSPDGWSKYTPYLPIVDHVEKETRK